MSRAGRRPATIADIVQRNMHEHATANTTSRAAWPAANPRPWASSRPIHELIIARQVLKEYAG